MEKILEYRGNGTKLRFEVKMSRKGHTLFTLHHGRVQRQTLFDIKIGCCRTITKEENGIESSTQN